MIELNDYYEDRGIVKYNVILVIVQLLTFYS